jgi:hypothetical protein
MARSEKLISNSSNNVKKTKKGLGGIIKSIVSSSNNYDEELPDSRLVLIDDIKPNPINRSGRLLIKKGMILNVGEIELDRLGEEEYIDEIKERFADRNPNISDIEAFKQFDDLLELAININEIGLIEPIVIRHNETDETKFEIIAGERRYLANIILGRETIHSQIKDVDDIIRMMLSENIQRSNMSIDQVFGLLVLVEDKEGKKSVREWKAYLNISHGMAQRYSTILKRKTDELFVKAINSGGFKTASEAADVAKIESEKERHALLSGSEYIEDDDDSDEEENNNVEDESKKVRNVVEKVSYKDKIKFTISKDVNSHLTERLLDIFRNSIELETIKEKMNEVSQKNDTRGANKLIEIVLEHLASTKNES